MNSETKRKLIRLIKDQERIRIAYELIECLESMIFYRGKDRTNLLVKLKELNERIGKELEYLEEE